MQKVKQAVILCAGKGERMGDRFRNVQKCTLGIQGKPLVLETASRLVDIGIEEIFLLTGHRAEQVENLFRDSPYQGIIRFIFCGDPYKIPLAVLTTLVQAKPYISEPFLCVHGDILFDSSIVKALMYAYDARKYFMAIAVATRKEPALTHSRIVYDNNLVAKSIEAPESSDAEVYMGLDLYPQQIFNYCEGASLHPRDLLQVVLAEGKQIRVVLYRKKWFHLVSAEDIKEVVI